MKRVEFRLTMPRSASWNGQWSGEGRNHVLYKNLPDAKCKELDLDRSWFHSWEDGWEARITARVMAKGERKQKSHGFCGYEWMVNNIIAHGSTRKEAPKISGGHFDHSQFKIMEIADEVEQLIFGNNDETLNEFGDRKGYFFTPETIDEFKNGLECLRKAHIYAQRIDWLVSGDDGEESFHARLKEELLPHKSNLDKAIEQVRLNGALLQLISDKLKG